jgi:hypothetical protein
MPFRRCLLYLYRRQARASDVGDIEAKSLCSFEINQALIASKKNGPLIADSKGNRISGQTKYLRLKIKNRGKTFAKNVSLCVTQVTYKSGGVGEKTFPEEVFELRLAQTETVNPFVFNLTADGIVFLDLVHADADPVDRHRSQLIFDFGIRRTA